MSIETVEQRGRLIGASPILAHRMTNRYAFEVDKLRKLLNSTEYYTNSKDVIWKLGLIGDVENSNERNWPSQQDLFVSLTAILEIQSFYDLKAEQVTKTNQCFKMDKVIN